MRDVCFSPTLSFDLIDDAEGALAEFLLDVVLRKLRGTLCASRDRTPLSCCRCHYFRIYTI